MKRHEVISGANSVPCYGRIVVWAIILSVLSVAGSALADKQDLKQAVPVTPYYMPPQKMDLCGDPVPLSDESVWERFDREFTIVVYAHAQVYLWLKRMRRYLPWIEEQLHKNGLPEDLKYMAVAESDLLYYAYSPARAAGLWQFIPSTGKRYGLRRQAGVDERYDFQKATHSALLYLKDLYNIFHNWPLAIAAYNCGEKRIQQELKRQRVSTFYDLKLPLETERYVFRILAIKAVLNNPEHYGYHLPENAAYPPLRVDMIHALFKTSIPVEAVAQAMGITYREFKVLNPAYRSREIPSGSHSFRVPEGMGPRAESGLKNLVAHYKPRRVAPRVTIYRVKKGDNLTQIARRYGVSVRNLKRWNKIKGSKIYVGQRLKIYWR